MRKISNILSIAEGTRLRMVDAFEADLESGSHHQNNINSRAFTDAYPTITAAFLEVEKERDELWDALNRLVSESDEHNGIICDCRPEPENNGHVCAMCMARLKLGVVGKDD